MRVGYVHGYSEYEAGRLVGSAATLSEALHAGTHYPPGSRVLEAGCGVGGQTRVLRRHSPGADIVSIDLSYPSLRRARHDLHSPGAPFRAANANLFHLPFAPESFDHVFVCFVLEHVPEPETALAALREVLRPDGTLTVIEGDHGSCYWYPETPEGREVWECLTIIQRDLGGDALIGRRLYKLLDGASFKQVRVRPAAIYCDPSRPEWMDGFVDKTICGMLRGIEDEVLARGMMGEADWRKGFNDILAIRDSVDGSFCYTFFKGVAVRSGG